MLQHELRDFEGIRGIGPSRAEALRAMGICSLRDLLCFFPQSYEDHRHLLTPDSREEETGVVEGLISRSPESFYFHGTSRVTAMLSTKSHQIRLCWFNQPWMARSLPLKTGIRLYGRISRQNGFIRMVNPRLITDQDIIPVYRKIQGIPGKLLRDWIEIALKRRSELFPEWMPDKVIQDFHLIHLDEAVFQIHFPENEAQLTAARRRLNCDGMITYLSYIFRHKQRHDFGIPFQITAAEENEYWKNLPFQPTAGQRRALHDIAEDLKSMSSMKRLLQGDVGCGKTAVAFGAIYLAWKSGHQASMMAPTEILARQHYLNALHTLEPLGIRCALLTSEIRGKEREEILAGLEKGQIHILFGTHALISRTVHFQDLQLTITDEQHRFGVLQRSALEKKGAVNRITYPHVLVMSATPIPRSLALILYGDLDITVIDELPSGRIPVKTRIVPEEKRNDMYRFVAAAVSQGRQAYIVCPRVEETETESEKEESHPQKSVQGLYQDLKHGALSGLKLGITWGSQKADEKQNVLDSFMQGKIQVLISTTVIEVGINNPNATIMIIENAERFGLSQLHQLRGRVGRGREESWCFLMTENEEKLRILCDTTDGFLISRKDLEIRGPGDFMGTRQSGAPAFPGIQGDMRLLGEISDYLKKLRQDPDQSDIMDKLEEHAEQHFTDTENTIALN